MALALLLKGDNVDGKLVAKDNLEILENELFDDWGAVFSSLGVICDVSLSPRLLNIVSKFDPNISRLFVGDKTDSVIDILKKAPVKEKYFDKEGSSIESFITDSLAGGVEANTIDLMAGIGSPTCLKDTLKKGEFFALKL